MTYNDELADVTISHDPSKRETCLWSFDLNKGRCSGFDCSDFSGDGDSAIDKLPTKEKALAFMWSSSDSWRCKGSVKQMLDLSFEWADGEVEGEIRERCSRALGFFEPKPVQESSVKSEELWEVTSQKIVERFKLSMAAGTSLNSHSHQKKQWAVPESMPELCPRMTFKASVDQMSRLLNAFSKVNVGNCDAYLLSWWWLLTVNG